MKKKLLIGGLACVGGLSILAVAGLIGLRICGKMFRDDYHDDFYDQLDDFFEA